MLAGKNYSANNELSTSMRGLIQRVSLITDKPARIVTFISSRPREGTSTIASAYAKALAADGSQKVLLIDAGQWGGKRVRALDIDPSIGIIDTMISGQLPTQAIRSSRDNISIGRWIGSDENRAVANKFMQRPDFWQELSFGFDALVIDAPSLQSSYDGIVLATKTDATIMVVEAEKTPRVVVKNLAHTLESAGANVAGVVMNKRRFYIPRRVYKNL